MKRLMTIGMLIVMMIFVLLSCNMEIESKNTPIDFNNIELNYQDEILLFSSQLIAYKLDTDNKFKTDLIDKLFDANGTPIENVFLYPILKDIASNSDDLGSFLSSINSNSTVIREMLERIKNYFPLIVVKVPRWYNESTRSDKTGVIPYIKLKEFEKQYNVYKYQSTLEVDLLDTKIREFDFIPILVRFSEYHKLADINNLIDERGEDITGNDSRIFDIESPCHPKKVILNHIEETPWFASNFKIINWFRFINDFQVVRCHEICGNGIDDDGDGLIDEKSCYGIRTIELCNNGIDDDGDGDIDEDDSDCCYYYSDCLRDCSAEANYLEGLKMGNIAVALSMNYDLALDDLFYISLIHGLYGTNSENIITGFLLRDSHSCNKKRAIEQGLFQVRWSRNYKDHGYLYSRVNAAGTDLEYANITRSLWVYRKILWHKEWDATELGEIVRTNVYYIIDGKFAWDLGNFDMKYCESNDDFQFDCYRNDGISTTGYLHNTGAVKVLTSIDIE